MNDLCICVLAHNEQKNIATTVRAIAANCPKLNPHIKVYANGCTDDTVHIVRELTHEILNLSVRELEIASKPNAWNIAFYENNHDILIFSDGDVVPQEGAVESLYKLLTNKSSDIVLAGCRFWPAWVGASIEQRFTGFLQIPFNQDFLTGGFYAVRRQLLALLFERQRIDGIPIGIVGEDYFLEKMVPQRQFKIVNEKSYYNPPQFDEYLRYLARMKWQEKQLALVSDGLFHGFASAGNNLLLRVFRKLKSSQVFWNFPVCVFSSMSRFIVKSFFKQKIQNYYIQLGAVGEDGQEILCKATRSVSTK